LFNVGASRMSRLDVSPDGQNVIGLVGHIGANVGGSGMPEWRGNLGADYTSGPFGLSAQLRYIGGGKYDSAWTREDYSRNDISAITYLNLSARYDMQIGDHAVQLYGGVDNALDKDPIINPENFFIVGYTNYGLYDVVGRRYFAGVRVKF